MPTALLELAYEEPSVAPVWIDESAYLRSFSTSRGRNEETETIEPGRGSFVLDNRTGRFDPAYRSSPVYPRLLPHRRIRISASVETSINPFTMGSSALGDVDALEAGTQTLSLFLGEIETVEPATDGFDAVVVVTAVDAQKRFKDMSVPAIASSEPSAARVNRVLDLIAWPTLNRAVATGRYNVQTTAAAVNVATHLDAVSASEGFVYYIDRSGNFAWRGPQQTIRTYGDVSTEERYLGFEGTPLDDTRIRNHIQVDGYTGGPAQTMDDPVSQGRYGYKPLPVQTWLIDAPPLAKRCMELLLAYREPQLRVTKFNVGNRSTDWLVTLRADIQDGIVFRHRPPYGGVFEQSSVIEGVAITSPSKDEWRVEWSLSALPHPNLLSEQASSFELTTDISEWSVGSNCSLAHNVYGAAVNGGDALRLTVTAGGDFYAKTTSGYPVTEGKRYVAGAYFANETGANKFQGDARVRIQWQDASHALLSRSDGNTVTLGSIAGAWKESVAEFVAPASAAFAVVEVFGVSGIASDKMFADAIWLHEAVF